MKNQTNVGFTYEIMKDLTAGVRISGKSSPIRGQLSP